MPSSISRIDPMPSPPPSRISASSITETAPSRAPKPQSAPAAAPSAPARDANPIATPAGMVHAAASSSETFTRRNVAAAPSAAQQPAPCTGTPESIAGHSAKQDRVQVAATGAPRADAPGHATCAAMRPVALPAGLAARQLEIHALSVSGVQLCRASDPTACDRRSRFSIGERRRCALSTCSNLNLSRPGDQRPPDQLVDQHDHRDHRRQAPHNRRHVARARPPSAGTSPAPAAGNRACPARTSRTPSGRTIRPPPTPSNSTPGRSRRTAVPAARTAAAG